MTLLYPTRTKKYFTKNKGIIYYNKWRAITGLDEAYYEMQPRDSIDRQIYQVGTFYVKKGVKPVWKDWVNRHHIRVVRAGRQHYLIAETSEGHYGI